MPHPDSGGRVGLTGNLEAMRLRNFTLARPPVIISLYVRPLPIVEAEADHRELFRDCSVGGRLVPALQRRSDAAHSCDPAAPDGTDPSDFEYALGFGSSLGKSPFDCDGNDQREIRDRRDKASLPRSIETAEMFDPGRRVLRMEKNGRIQAALLLRSTRGGAVCLRWAVGRVEGFTRPMGENLLDLDHDS